MPQVTQVNDTTWHIIHNSITYTVHKYYDGGYTIAGTEGIYNSFQEIISNLIRFY